MRTKVSFWLIGVLLLLVENVSALTFNPYPSPGDSSKIGYPVTGYKSDWTSLNHSKSLWYKPTTLSPMGRPSYTGFYFGLNIGALWANKYQANFYNGASGNVDSIGLVFNNYYYREDIRRELNDTFRLLELPTEMRYKATYQIGFYIRYNFVRNSGIFIQFNYAKLEAKDFFTMGIGGTPQYLTFDNIQLFPIWGKEERIYIDIGGSQTFPLDKVLGLYMEAGLNINNTRVLENKIAIGSLEYSLINIYGTTPYIPNTQMQTYQVHLGGLGIGAFLSAGLRANFDKNISLDLGGTFHWNNANLEGYERYRPHAGAYLRLCFRKLYNENEDSKPIDD